VLGVGEKVFDEDCSLVVGFNRVGCDHDSSLLQSDIKGTGNPADTFNLTPCLLKHKLLNIFLYHLPANFRTNYLHDERTDH